MDLIDNKYQILRKLGEGFGGCVLLAEAEGKQIALKQLEMDREGLNPREILESFKTEFTTLTKLNHPNIVRIMDFGYDSSNDFYYFTTEFIEGLPVFEATRESTSQEIEEYFVQALRALSYLHNQNIYHLDIKSQNILLGDNHQGDQVVKLIDFGLSGFRKSGFLAGTPRYLPPEALVGQSLDGRADLYSLGITWYECLAGYNPFDAGDLREVLKRQRSFIPPPISTQNVNIPAYLDPILDKLLRKNPANRYHRADQVIRDLNWLGNKNYALETDATALAYLPGEGKLVGRSQEWETLLNYYNRVFSSNTDLKSGVVISGPPGTGKSRLIKELKYHAQLQAIPVFEGKPYLQKGSDHDCIIIVDDADEDTFELAERCMLMFHRYSMLIILASDSIKTASGKWHHILLKNFDRPDVESYVSSVLGMPNPPSYLVNELANRTEGNPLFLTEMMRALIQSHQMFDEHGRWSPTRLEDIGINFAKSHVPKTLTEYCQKKYRELPEAAQNILLTNALAKYPLSRTDLIKLGCLDDLSDYKCLQEEDLLTVDATGKYQLVNPSFKDWVPNEMEARAVSQIHESLGKLFRDDPLRADAADYHLGFGLSGDSDRYQSLLKYGDLLFERSIWHDAIVTFRAALELASRPDEKVETNLRLVRALFRAGEHSAALKVFDGINKILKIERENALRWRWVQQTMREMGSIYIKEGKLDLAHETLEASRVLLEEHEDNDVEEMILSNLKASLFMREGKISQAMSLSEENYRIWSTWPWEKKKQILNNELGNIYLVQGKIKEAKQFLSEQSEFFKEVGNLTKQASSLYGLALCEYSLKNYDEAVKLYHACLEISRSIKNEELLFHAFNELGNIIFSQKNWNQAAEYYQRALELAQHLSDVNNCIGITINLANVLQEQGDSHGAGLYLRHVITSLESQSSLSLIQLQFLIQAYLAMGAICLEKQLWTEARDMFRDALKLIQGHAVLERFRFSSLLGLIEADIPLNREPEAKNYMEELKNYPFSSSEQARFMVVKEKLQPNKMM